MLQRVSLLPVSLVVALGLSAASLSGQDVGRGDRFYVVAEYDGSRDPFSDLEVAVQRAQSEGKRILLEVGGVWCIWCKILDRYIEETPVIAEELQRNFVVVKVNWDPENQNRPFLSRYPEIPGYPHLYVLDSDGSFLYSQDTSKLEEGRSYNEAAFVEFLEKWSPRREDSEKL